MRDVVEVQWKVSGQWIHLQVEEAVVLDFDFLNQFILTKKVLKSEVVTIEKVGKWTERDTTEDMLISQRTGGTIRFTCWGIRSH